jgi:hypothetical protein
MDVILYPGGAAGNLVCAMIDDRGYKFDGKHYEPLDNRIKLRNRKYMEEMTNEDRDRYMKIMEVMYRSIPSHMYHYHIQNSHPYILVAPMNDEEMHWVIDRFKKIHPNDSTISMEEEYAYRKKFVDDAVKHTDKIISMADIWSGNLVNCLKRYVSTPLNEELYQIWLKSEINTKTRI